MFGSAEPKGSITVGKTIASFQGLYTAEFIVILSSALAPTIFIARAITAKESTFYFGMLGSLYSVGVFLSYIVGPALLAKFSFRLSGIIALPALILGSLSGLVSMPEAWLLGRLLVGLGSGLFFLTIEAWIGIMTAGTYKVQALALYSAVIYAAYVVAQGLLFYLPPTTNDPILFSILCAAIGFFALMRAGKPMPAAPKVINPLQGINIIFRNAPESILMTFVSGLLIGANSAFGPTYAVEIGLPPDQVSLSILVTLMGALIFQPLLGRLANSYGAYTVLIGMGLSTLVTSIILYQFVSWGWIVAVVLLLWGGTTGTGYAIAASIAHSADHGRHPVEVARIALILNGVGGIIGPLFATLFVSMFGSRGLYVFVSILAIIIVFIMFGTSILKAHNNNQQSTRDLKSVRLRSNNKDENF